MKKVIHFLKIEEKSFEKQKSSKLLQNSFQSSLNQKYTPT
jgi:hypothetical protein